MKFCNNCILLACLAISFCCPGQDAKIEVDSSYIETLENYFNARFYFSQKYTSLRFTSVKNDYEVNYLPNTSLNMGVGATYKWATLNLAYGFNFLNIDSQRGKTKWLDLQTHQYFRTLTVDVFGSYYSGFYLTPAGKAAPAGKEYYVRPDLSTLQLGSSVQYIFNHRKFSYKALFLQNEWQKTSAGSPLIGFEFYVVKLNSDSTLIPSTINSSGSLNTSHFTSYQFGPNLGYAYTYVIKQNFYISVSGSVSFDVGKNSLTVDGRRSPIALTSNFFIRAFAGYNSKRWSIGIFGINSVLSLAKLDYNERVTLHSGNIRLNYIYRFIPKKSVRKTLHRIVN